MNALSIDTVIAAGSMAPAVTIADAGLLLASLADTALLLASFASPLEAFVAAVAAVKAATAGVLFFPCLR